MAYRWAEDIVEELVWEMILLLKGSGGVEGRDGGVAKSHLF